MKDEGLLTSNQVLIRVNLIKTGPGTCDREGRRFRETTSTGARCKMPWKWLTEAWYHRLNPLVGKFQRALEYKPNTKMAVEEAATWF